MILTRRPTLPDSVLTGLLTGLLVGLLVAVVPVAPALAGDPARAAEGPVVTGYVLGGAGDALVAENAAALTTLGVDGVTITADGRDVRRPTRDTRRLVATAHAQGLRAELLVSNYSDRLGDFDTRAAGRLLRNEQHVRRVAARLAGFVVRQGWDGVTVDLESLRRADARGLVLLLEELQARMPAAKGVSVDLMASTSVRGYRDAGYALPGIAAAADLVAVMTYDLHGPTWSGPGPIGPRGWQRRAVEALLTRVPADQVDLGVAGYGYTWPTRSTGRAVPVRRARALVAADGATATWRPGPAEWTATLSDGTVLWWSDARSYAARVALAEEYALHGLALWRLGSADPLTP